METIAPAERKEYTLSYDLRIRPPAGNPILLTHKVTPLRLAEDGKIWLALCRVSLSSQTKPGNLEMSRKGSNGRWRYDMDNKAWIQGKEIKLSKYEKTVLLLSAQGCTMDEIAQQTYKSLDSIKTYKRQIKKINGSE